MVNSKVGYLQTPMGFFQIQDIYEENIYQRLIQFNQKESSTNYTPHAQKRNECLTDRNEQHVARRVKISTRQERGRESRTQRGHVTWTPAMRLINLGRAIF